MSASQRAGSGRVESWQSLKFNQPIGRGETPAETGPIAGRLEAKHTTIMLLQVRKAHFVRAQIHSRCRQMGAN